MLKVYIYKGCSTCRDAVKWLNDHGIQYEEKAIRETPPTMDELNSMLKAKVGQIRPLFNTSGMDYRAQGLKDKLPEMSTEEALTLLTQNGNLVKRPFVLDPKAGVHLVGFKAPEWEKALAK